MLTSHKNCQNALNVLRKGSREPHQIHSMLVEKKNTGQIGLIMIGTLLKHTVVVSLFKFSFRDRAMNVLLNVFIIHCVKP